MTETELELSVPYSEAVLLGAYDHIYDDNVFSEPGVNTHYVALGHSFVLTNVDGLNLGDQHSEMSWWSEEDLLLDASVHPNTKAYFY